MKFCEGARFPNEPVSQYRCVNLPKTDDKDRTHKNDANALSLHMINASMLHIWSMPRRKNEIGGRGLRTYFFLEKLLEWFWFFLYPWKFQVKQNSTHGHFVKWYMLHTLEILRLKQNTLKGSTTRNLVKLCMLHPLEISRPKPKTSGNFTWIFLGFTWIFHVVFS